jgi:hypothetical protein
MNTVRDENGKWLNPDAFREPALAFKEKGYYCPDPWGSPAWADYWHEQRRRCIKGYSVEGIRIPGEFYFYLNFCPIQKVEDPHSKITKKVNTFGDFWDGDFIYFWCRSIARYGIIESLDEEVKEQILKLPEEEQKLRAREEFDNLNLGVEIEDEYLHGNQNFIVGKSRRKGYSYKAASIAACNYYTKPNSLTIFGAYEKKFLYPRGIFTMANNYINFINEHTGWGMPSDVIEKQDHRKGSYIIKLNGINIEKGFKSEIVALTFKDNADAARGKDAVDIFFEESGAFGTPGLLKDSYAASQDCVMAGVFKTGMITVFGTSGDMEGGTADYADMFSRPAAFDFLPFKNKWDDGMESTDCGFFHPINWNMEGQYDRQGNSFREEAKKTEIDYRDFLVKNGATSSEIQKRMQEKPLGPAEAFAAVSVNNFPVVELKAQLNLVKAKGWQQTHGTPVHILYKEGKAYAKPILDGSDRCVTSYHMPPADKRGNIMIYEQPVENAAKGLYKIGYDPIRQDEGTSLAAIIVYKGVHTGSQHHSIIVAEYIGRMESAADIDRIAEQLADLYNTQIMYENEVPGVKNYFRRIKRLHLLALQPDAVISKNVKRSRTARVYGCHMNLQLKDAGERYVKDWLLEVLDYDEDGNPIRTIDKIYSIRLLEELISYSRKGNFDLVSSLFMCMFQVQEESLDMEYGEKKENKNVKDLLKMMKDMYK